MKEEEGGGNKRIAQPVLWSEQSNTPTVYGAQHREPIMLQNSADRGHKNSADRGH